MIVLLGYQNLTNKNLPPITLIGSRGLFFCYDSGKKSFIAPIFEKNTVGS